MLSDLIYRLRSLWRRSAAESELDEELAFHIEHETEKLMRAGLPPEEAGRRARLATGGSAQIKEDVRAEWGWRWCEDLLQDGRYAFRALRQSPMFAAVAVLSLALGIGANTAIFSIVNAVVMKSLPVPDPERLAAVQISDNQDSFTYALWEQIRDHQDVFSGMLAYDQAIFDLAVGGERRPAHGYFVSGDYFRTLGIPALIGRVLTPDDDRRGGGTAGPVAVLSYGFWQREYAGDPNIMGRTIRLDDHPFQVVGVTPASFFGLEVGRTFDVMVPVTSEAVFQPDRSALDQGTYWWLSIMGRLKPGISPALANARLKALAPGIFQATLPPEMAGEFRSRFLANPLGLKPAPNGASSLRQEYGRPLRVLMGIVGLVLLIACVNIANLLLARAGSRQKEIAVRMAVGAGRGRLVRQLLTESVILSLLGGAGGVLLSHWGGAAIVALISEPGDASFLDLTPDFRVLAFTAAAAVLTGILFGLAPAVRATRLTTAETLKQGARGITDRRGRWVLGRTLVIAQIALCLLLLVGAGLFTGSLRNLLNQDLGFQRDAVLLVTPDFRGARYPAQKEDLLAEQLLTQVRGIPGVRSASRSTITPIQRGSWQWDVQVNAPGGGRKKVHAYFNLVSPGYFQTLDTPVRRGRDFLPADTKNSLPVAIVNETAARQLFPGADGLGQDYFDAPLGPVRKEFAVRIVGVVKDAKYRSLREAPPPTVYLPFPQNPTPNREAGTYELLVAGPPAAVIGAVKRAAQDIDPRISLEFRFLAEQVAGALVRERLVATLATFFGLLALVLASAGLYGVVAYAATRRRNEMAIRMALGATRKSVLSLMLRDLGGLVLLGTPLGLGAAWACARLVRSMLFGLTPNDPATYAGASALLLLVAGVAGYLPARRASRQDPLAALREE